MVTTFDEKNAYINIGEKRDYESTSKHLKTLINNALNDDCTLNIKITNKTLKYLLNSYRNEIITECIERLK